MYRQIMEQVTRLVAAGQLEPGDTLPSVREVAAAHCINPMTVSKAYSRLSDAGLLVRRPGKGMAVAADVRPADAQSRWKLIDPELKGVARLATDLDLPQPEVVARLEVKMEARPQM